jgi:hypothetical protein
MARPRNRDSVIPQRDGSAAVYPLGPPSALVGRAGGERSHHRPAQPFPQPHANPRIGKRDRPIEEGPLLALTPEGFGR